LKNSSTSTGEPLVAIQELSIIDKKEKSVIEKKIAGNQAGRSEKENRKREDIGII
jgi:hypothetical protein